MSRRKRAIEKAKKEKGRQAKRQEKDKRMEGSGNSAYARKKREQRRTGIPGWATVEVEEAYPQPDETYPRQESHHSIGVEKDVDLILYDIDSKDALVFGTNLGHHVIGGSVFARGDMHGQSFTHLVHPDIEVIDIIAEEGDIPVVRQRFPPRASMVNNSLLGCYRTSPGHPDRLELESRVATYIGRETK